METIFRFIKHCDDCEKWPKDHWKKKKYYFQAATTMSKLMKAPKLSAWSMINAVGSPLTSLLLLVPLDISRGSHPCKHTALPPPARRSRQHERAGKRRAPMQKIQLGTGKSSINSVANTFPNHQLHYLNAPRNIWFRNAKTLRTVSFSSSQRNLIKTFQIEGMIALIAKMDLIFSSDLLNGQK